MDKPAPTIDRDFVVLGPDKTATIEPCDSTLYQRLEQNYAGFKGYELVSCHRFDRDWETWEIHPHGDEIVILLSGCVTFVLQLEGGEDSIRLDREGMFAIVPRNVWHRALTDVDSRLLFITPGQDTRHRQAQAGADA